MPSPLSVKRHAGRQRAGLGDVVAAGSPGVVVTVKLPAVPDGEGGVVGAGDHRRGAGRITVSVKDCCRCRRALLAVIVSG